VRRVRYSVAASLDGYIAGPSDDYGWIPEDPEIDFGAFLETIDTLLVGRRTYEVASRSGDWREMPGTRTLVFSRTLDPADHPGVDVVADDAAAAVRRLKASEGKDIWLFGGGRLFRSLLDAELVDTVEVAIVPILLGGGVPLLPSGPGPVRLELSGEKTFPSGIVLARYTVNR